MGFVGEEWTYARAYMSNVGDVMTTRLLRTRYAMAAVLMVGLFGFLLILGRNADTASATGLNQGAVVPESVRTDVPVVLDGRVRAHAVIGDRVFVGGDFQQVELNDGTVVDQPYLFAYDIDSGAFDTNFRPVLDDSIRSLDLTEDGQGLYVSGRFIRWDDTFVLRVARIDGQGNLDTSWTPDASARVRGVVEIGDSVYIGGNFTEIGGVPVTGLAKVDRVTGAVDTSFSPSLVGSVAGSALVQALERTPDGSSLFVLHYASLLDGQVREAVAKFDIDAAGTPSLSGWNIPWSAQAGRSQCLSALRDLEISPDGTYLVIGGQGADNPPNCDSVLRYPTAGNATVNFDWSARMYSSVYSLAVSDVAVYVGGHFCAAPRNGAEPGGVTSDFLGTANGCDVNNPLNPINPSQRDPEGAVFRSQMAALNPENGQALPWDPGSNNLVAVFDLTLTERGLLAGHDSTRFNGFFTGRSGFFDFGAEGPDLSAPTIAITSPVDGTVAASISEIAGTANDDREVRIISVQLQNTTTGQWLQPNGSFASTPADLAISAVGVNPVNWSRPVANLPLGDYQLSAAATDPSGNTSTTAVSNFVIADVADPATCTVALNANDQPVVTLVNFDPNLNAGSISITRDGSLIDTIDQNSTSYVDTAAAPGARSYVVGWSPGGVATDVSCSPSSIVVPDGNAITRCTVSLNADNDPVLTWDPIDGVTSYVVRDVDRGWLATVDGALTYTEQNAAPGEYNFLLRVRPPGVGRTDVACTPSPLTVPDGGGDPVAFTCNAALDGAGGVLLTWDIDSVTTFQVRDNDGWVATVENSNTFIDANPGAGDRTYVIRYRPGGGRVDLTCAPPVNAG